MFIERNLNKSVTSLNHFKGVSVWNFATLLIYNLCYLVLREKQEVVQN